MNYKGRAPFQSAAFVESQRNLTYFDKSLTSGLTDTVIESPGDFLYVDQASTGVVSIELNMRQGGTLAPILLAAGGSIECDFNSFKLNATAQLNKTVRIIVGNGARIKSGANVNATSDLVTTVPGQKSISAAGNAFMTYTGIAASPGNYSHTQIFNPSSNTKTVFVTSICPLTVNMALQSYSTALANGPYSIPSIKPGASAAGCVVRTEAAAAALGTDYYGVLFANQYFRPDRPICLPPGKGVLLSPQGVNTACYVTFELFEE